MRPRVRIPALPRLSELSVISQVLLGNGLLDALVPNPTTAAPLMRVLDRQYVSKKKRGWAWFFLMCGLMKVQSALSSAPVGACVGGWAYAAQAVAMAMEGFYHRSIPRASKVLGSHIAFSVAMWIWLQVVAWRHMQRSFALAAGNPQAASELPMGWLEPNAPPREPEHEA